LKKETRKDKPDLEVVKKLYKESTHLSGHIYSEIRSLKQIEHTLLRPFVFDGKIFDSDHMHNQMKRRRIQILNQFAGLTGAQEINLFLTKAGEVSNVGNVSKEELEL